MSIFSNLKPEAHNSRSAFDLSRRDVYSAKSGMVTPCLCLHTIPESVYECTHLSITRLKPIQSPAFVRLQENYEYFFVPYSQIYHDFERFYYERGDNQRNPVTSQGQFPTDLPSFNLYDFLVKLYPFYHLERFIEEWLSFVSANHSADYSRAREYFSVFCSLQSQNSLENAVLCLDVHNRCCSEDVLRNLDLLGYGNYLPLFKNFYTVVKDASQNPYDQIFSDLYDYMFNLEVVPWSQYVVQVNALFIQDFTASSCYTYLEDTFASRSLSVFPICAFLKVWSDIYRNTQYDVDVDYSRFFNCDWYAYDSSQIDPYVVIRCLLARYRQYKKDIFTGSYPNAQFGSVAVAGLDNPTEIYASSVPSSTRQANVGGTNGILYVTGEGGARSWNVQTGISALAVRQALALQRYKERILRAGNRLTSLQRAVFGDKSRYLEDAYVDFIGSNSSVIDINTVASTADVGSSQVGELSANGVGTHNGKAFEYHAHDFGMIIGIYYVLPESEYNAYMVDSHLTKSESSDFYKPDFQNLGLQPVISYDYNFIGCTQDNVIGYLARYWEYKTAVDKVHGEFFSGVPFTTYYSDNYQQRLLMEESKLVTKGVFSQYVTPRSPSAFLYAALSALYCRPDDIDNIFYSLSDSHQSSDQFLINCNHIIKAVLPMSVIGLPEY